MIAIAIAVASMMPVAAARADDAASEAAFEEGLRLMEANDLEKACPALARAVEVTGGHAVGGLLVLADCYERAGRSASAWATYRKARAFATEQNQPVRREQADAGVARLEPTLVRLKIVVPPEVAGLSGLVVKRDDVVVAPEALGVAIPVDPGVVVVRAEAPRHMPFETELKVSAGDGTKELRLGPLAPSRPPPSPEEGDDFGRLGIAGVVIGATGLAGLGVALGLSLAAKGDYDDAIADPELECSGTVCNVLGKQATDEARYFGDVASATAIIGGALTAIGTAMVVIEVAAPFVRKQSMAVSFGPLGFQVRGAFQ